jgi:hypothetical protein
MNQLREAISQRVAALSFARRSAPRPIAPEHMRAAEALVTAGERVGSPSTCMSWRRNRIHYHRGERAKGRRPIAVQQRAPTMVDPPLRIGDEPKTFKDNKGNRFVVHSSSAVRPTTIAADVRASLRPRDAHAEPSRVIIDVSNMTIEQQRTLRSTLQTLANKVPKLDLGRRGGGHRPRLNVDFRRAPPMTRS